MKALTLQQPWATLVAIGAKKIETRSWKTDYRGPLAIHVSKDNKYIHMRGKDYICGQEPFCSVLKTAAERLFREVGMSQRIMPLGAVIATCNLVDCFEIRGARPVKRDGKIVNTAFLEARNRLIEVGGNELAFGDYSPGRYAWLLEDVKMLPEPVPVKGRLGLWEWDQQNENRKGLLLQGV
jgi:hypothetical protein